MRAAQRLLMVRGSTWGRCGQAPDDAAGGALRKIAGLAGVAQPDCGQGPGGAHDSRKICAPQRGATVAAGYGDASVTHRDGLGGRDLHAPDVWAC